MCRKNKNSFMYRKNKTTTLVKSEKSRGQKIPHPRCRRIAKVG
jgi:hypothetical protein